MSTARLTAHAKLTFSLRVTGRRDDGYHLIDAEMQSLDLADVLRIDEGGTGISVVGPFAAGVPTDQRNLVARALRLLERTASVEIDKRIPHGGGLGGGSTDAAAVLRWGGCTDPIAASTIGADVAFCLRGGRARVTGIGEQLEPLPHLDRVVTLVIPPLHVSTPAVYRTWDDLGGPTADGVNDLEPAALVAEPALRTWRDRIGELTGDIPVLAGSGATWFVEGRRDDALAPLAGEGARVVVARTVDPRGTAAGDDR
ncbi:MAG: 4-(cytidine 5'-diphospho)-2-C-methyl-D-erythritol kinase [Ilumatobacteraceae bacterium]|nr:4-(cytidine 5'-diphospho)-2-C-methyl-D-erythritol kinase [Ilumatobacteraceae bacterium]